MVIAYLRISTEKQHIENQKDEIQKYADDKGIIIDRWVTETISGTMTQDKRKLGRLIKSIKTGDTLIVTEISRLSRTLHEVMAIMGQCLSRNITIYSTKDGYSFDDSINSKVLSFAFGLVAEIERNLISQRTKQALAMRKAQGVILGRKIGECPKLKVLRDNKNEIYSMVEGNYSITEIHNHFGVSRSTFFNYRQEDQDLDDMIIFKKNKEMIDELQKSVMYRI